MPLHQEVKQQVINEYQVHGTDTGSTEVQIAMLTARVKQLSEHLKTNKKDHSSRRGLLKVIGRRKRLMAYLQRQDRTKYQELIQKLGIRG
ncbi:MAG: 30S ribosomal protein S15 [Cyanobacteria bacterium P01_H01_bin.130]